MIRLTHAVATLRTLLRSLVSEGTRDALYRERKANLDSHGVRTRLTAGVCLAIAALLFSFMMSLTVRNDDPQAYIRGRANVSVVARNAMRIEYGLPLAGSCADSTVCYAEAKQHPAYDLDATARPVYPATYSPLQPGETRHVLVGIHIPVSAVKVPEGVDDLMVQLPRLWFERATVFVDGRSQATYLGSDPVAIPLKTARFAEERALLIEVVLDLAYGQDMRFVARDEPVFVASHYEWSKYVDFLETLKTNPVSQVGIIARVVMAIFALLLFIIIESSPEALGLALALGFEALAMTLTFVDLRRYWIPDTIDLTGVIHYANAMGDMFRLYFYLQLCRLVPPAAGKWLAWTSLYAAIYGAMRHWNPDIGMPNWAIHHIIQRDLSVATIGMVLCASTAWQLRNKGLPWRVGALTLATFAATAQWFTAAPFYLPFVSNLGLIFGSYSTFIAMVDANCAYLFALSTFVNISTLENRVKVLSREKTRAEAMERELELGRSVQRAFLKLPSMPPEIGMSCHYEAAVYVSGDTYFVHWNKTAQILTFLLNDVTGHGIQAALKAFACNVIARSVWNKPWVRNDRQTAEVRLRRYDEAVVELLCKDEDNPDFNAMVGVEFHLEQRMVRLYRVNYNSPILVEPTFDIGDLGTPVPNDAWQIRTLTIPNQTVVEMPIKEGAFVILVSDGFLQTARDQHHFVGYLSRTLKGAKRELNVSDLRSLALTWEHSAKVRNIDDRTLIIFQWNPHAASAANDPRVTGAGEAA